MLASSGRCSGPATVVHEPSLTDYDFGPDHPMSPVRVDLTLRLATDLGIVAAPGGTSGLLAVPAPMATPEALATVHHPALIEAVMAAGSDPAQASAGFGLGTEDNPAFAGMHEASARLAGGCVPGGAGFLLPDEGGQRGKAHVGVNAAVFVEHWSAEFHEAKTAAALPVHRLADAALFAVNDFLQARQAVRGSVVAHLDADPAPAHLVRDGGGGAAAEEAVEDEVVGLGGDVEHF